MRRSSKQVSSLNPAPVFMAAMLGVAALSQLKLQLFETGSTIEKAKEVKKWYVDSYDYAKRGAILDRSGKPLAQDATAYELSVNYAKMPKSNGLAIALSEATGIPAYAFLDRETGSRTWEDPLTPVQQKRIRAIQKDWNADGISIAPKMQRIYPLGLYASSLIGLERKEDGKEVKSGFESSYDKMLTGVDGLQRGLKDKNGQFLPLRSFEPEQVRVDGKTITTTIDSQIQYAAAKAIKEAVISNKADSGCVVVVHPVTGEILAMASWPAPDPAESGRSPFEGKNPNYKDALEPGSIFKIFTVAKAYDAGVINRNSITNCNLTLNIPKDKPIHCDKAHGAHGAVDPVNAIAQSCNVAAAQWSMKVGRDNYFDYLTDLGFTQKSSLGMDGSPLSGEVKNNLKKARWGALRQLAEWGFGQSLNLTPVTIAGAFATIANGGNRVPLTLVKAVDGKKVPQRLPHRVLKKESADFALECMQAVMEKGTGSKLGIAGYEFGGKTGTAQRMRGSDKKGYVSNFIGIVPAAEPEAVILVMVDNPKAGKKYGSEVAGPVFKQVAQNVIETLGLRPTLAPGQLQSAKKADASSD